MRMREHPTLQTTMAELTAGWPESAVVLSRLGMACVGCSMARFETIAEAAIAYGLRPEDLLADLGAAHRHAPAPAAGAAAPQLSRPGAALTPHRRRRSI